MSAAYINYGDLPIATEYFHCGEPSLDEFIKEHAQTFIQKGLSAVTLLIEVETRELIGFYAISPFAIDGRALRSEQSKYYDVTFPIPAWKIGLLAVDKKHQRNSNRRSQNDMALCFFRKPYKKSRSEQIKARELSF